MCHQASAPYAETRSVLPLAPAHVSLRRALVVGAAALGLACPAVAAAATPTPIDISATDPAGDATYKGVAVEPAADITGFAITQDRGARRVRGTVTFAGETATPGLHSVRIALGRPVDKDTCQVGGDFGIVDIRAAFGAPTGEFVVTTMTDVRGTVTASRQGATFTFETADGPFDGFGYRCIGVATERLLPSGAPDVKSPQDTVVGFAPPEEPAAKPDAPVIAAGGVPAPIIDTDGDGVHDGIDKCPAAAGAATNGCESVPLAKSLKLGTKRLVVDRLLSSTSGTCPATVKVVVKVGRKKVGAQTLGTMKKGKFCHVQGVVKLKKRVSKARVTIAGAGVVSVASTVAK